MTIADKIIRAKADYDAVYEAGKSQGGGGGYDEGYTAGQKAEYDRFWDEFQVNGTRKNYRYAFAGTNFNVETLNPKYVPIVLTGTYANSMFLNNTNGYPNHRDYTEICKKIDFSQITDASSLFQNICGKNITVDLSNCTTATNAFNCNSGGRVDNITLKVTEKLTSASQFFYYNSDLTTLTFTDDSVIAFALYLARSPKLTHESLMSIINALKDFRIVNSTYSNVTYSWNGTEGDGEIGKVYECTNAIKYNNSIELQCSWGNNEYDYRIIVLEVDNVNITEEELYNVKTFMIDSNGNLVLGIQQENPTTTKTLTIGDTNLAKLTDGQKAIATEKGWTLA